MYCMHHPARRRRGHLSAKDDHRSRASRAEDDDDRRPTTQQNGEDRGLDSRDSRGERREVPHGLLTGELGLDGEEWLWVDDLLGRR
jgi:hypothetical protein